MTYHRTIHQIFTPSHGPPAHGLHVRGTKTTYQLADLCKPDDPEPAITIGRHASCDIQLPDKRVSLEHAVITRRADGLWELHDRSRDGKRSRNGVHVNGERIEGSVTLRAGMRIRIGRTRFHGSNERGMVPITACTLDEFCYQLQVVYGNSCEAERRMGPHEKKHEFIRLHALEWRRRQAEQAEQAEHLASGEPPALPSGSPADPDLEPVSDRETPC